MHLVLHQSVLQSLDALFRPKYQYISSLQHSINLFPFNFYSSLYLPYPYIRVLLLFSINALLHNFQIQSITISPPFLILSPVLSSIPADLPFFNFLTLPITSSLLITSSQKYLFLLAPSNPHTFTITSSLLPIFSRFSKCSFHTPLTSILSVTKAPFYSFF